MAAGEQVRYHHPVEPPGVKARSTAIVKVMLPLANRVWSQLGRDLRGFDAVIRPEDLTLEGRQAFDLGYGMGILGPQRKKTSPGGVTQ